MNNKNLPRSKIFEPEYQITTAKELLLFTLLICNMFEKGEIEESKLNQTILVNNVLRIECKWPSDVSKKLAQNLRLSVLGNCFIVIDEALNGIFGKKPKKYSDNDIDSLRAIIYMLRCAIAHGPTAPSWKVKREYCRRFKIEEIDYELQLEGLDGKTVEHSDYGGLKGAMSLINYSLEIVRRHSNKAQIKPKSD